MPAPNRDLTVHDLPLQPRPFESNQPLSYTLGFLFREYDGPTPAIYQSCDYPEVALIQKLRPEWQAGKLNGIGGTIEPTDVDPHACQVREFQEETGLLVPAWRYFGVLRFAGGIVHLFTAWAQPGDKLKQLTDEKPRWVGVSDMARGDYQVIDNLYWLIPAALDPTTSFIVGLCTAPNVEVATVLEKREAPNLDELRANVGLLKSLLDDSHPGLSTWREAYERRVNELLAFFGK